MKVCICASTCVCVSETVNWSTSFSLLDSRVNVVCGAGHLLENTGPSVLGIWGSGARSEGSLSKLDLFFLEIDFIRNRIYIVT